MSRQFALCFSLGLALLAVTTTVAAQDVDVNRQTAAGLVKRPEAE